MKTQIALEAATATEMAEFAQDPPWNLDVTFRTGKDRILDKLIAAGFDGEFILATSHAPRVAGDDDPDPIPGDDEGNQWVTVMIPPSDGVGGDRFVELGCNGVVILVPRDGMPHKIRRRYYESLKHARYTIYDSIPDGGTKPGREVSAYPHSVTL